MALNAIDAIDGSGDSFKLRVKGERRGRGSGRQFPKHEEAREGGAGTGSQNGGEARRRRATRSSWTAAE